ncbi:MAG: hypothetical protein PHF37_10030, partial [Phycisphaerae bacterium]|nr:hypothetical protein [Phycisphaerae bacterium]
SDLQSDYHNSEYVRNVAIGWRMSKREDFKALRAAAGRYEPTSHLGLDADDSIEHRDNRSQGAGNYLKAGYIHDNGWLVESINLPLNNWLVLVEGALPEEENPELSRSGDGVRLLENTEKDGYELRFDEKPPDEILSRLKSNGWRWSRFNGCWYHPRTAEDLKLGLEIIE